MDDIRLYGLILNILSQVLCQYLLKLKGPLACYL